MRASAKSPHRQVKSWLGLSAGLIGIVSHLITWNRTGPAVALTAVFGFACLSYVWARYPFSLTKPFREQVAEGPSIAFFDWVLFWIGIFLLGLSLVLRWLG